ncbi:MAG: NYN domain-containing protein [Candidatus Diapherotrites archaeon]|uniref:NYN domain-containing protein n=2 Tax=Candidatus Iainarchaeum sp. TaxID=3101447 RepID=A0A8T4L884_9ARCH|nr:NYN domain-containing protein [Candidatus Diapherotrites archaeon]
MSDMLRSAYLDMYDVALLASGDADFVPAAELVQTLKKEVVNVHFYAGSSSELRTTCNAHKLVQVDATGNCYFR